MKTILTAILIFGFTASALGQTPGWVKLPDRPTPTIEQCRANYVMWADRDGSDFTSIGYRELNERGLDMSACSMVALLQHGKGGMTYQDADESTHYADMSASYIRVLMVRFRDFIGRHGQAQQFADEDAAGQH